MMTDEMTRFDVVRVTGLEGGEYDYLKKHPNTKKMREDCTFANMEFTDFSFIENVIKAVKVGKYTNAVYKESLIWGFYERNEGSFVSVIKNSLREKYGDVRHDTFYPITDKIRKVLDAMGLVCPDEKDSIICIVFKFEDKYVLVED